MLTVYLCDDNQGILERYRDKIEGIAKKYDITVCTRLFRSGAALQFALEDGKEKADIIYLDIVLDGENGIQTAAGLRENGCGAEIIFLTANPQYVFDSFDVSPTHYIVKDTVSDKRFEEIFLKAAVRSRKTTEDMYVCTNGNVQKQIPFRDIYYFEVVNRIITVHYGTDKFSFYMKLSTLEKSLSNKGFIRIHRSILVHLPYIEQISNDSVTLATKEILPLGVTYYRHVKAALNQYLSLSVD